MTSPLDLDTIEARVAEHRAALSGWLNCYSPLPEQEALEGAEGVLKEDVEQLAAEVRRLRAEVATAVKRDVTSPLAVIAKYGDMSETARREINDLLAEATAEQQEAQRLERMTSRGQTPHTPRLCECGHSHHAHTVPAPHSCFAFGQTCPCKAYQQLPHDRAVAQLKANQQAAAERAAAARPAGAANEDGTGSRP